MDHGGIAPVKNVPVEEPVVDLLLGEEEEQALPGPHEGGQLKDCPECTLEADGKTKAREDWAQVAEQSCWGQGGVLACGRTMIKVEKSNRFPPNVVSSKSKGAPTTERQTRYMSRKASPPCWTTAIGRDLEENLVNGMGLQLLGKTRIEIPGRKLMLMVVTRVSVWRG